MRELGEPGRGLIVLGTVILGLGVVLTLLSRLSGIPRLPGDLLLKRGGFTLYIPITSCLLASLLLTLAFQFWRR